MSVSAQIKALLSLTGNKQSDLVEALGMASKQSLSNKFTGERWSADDLIEIANFAGCRLAFVLPDGERLLLGDPVGDVGNEPGLGESL